MERYNNQTLKRIQKDCVGDRKDISNVKISF